MKKIKRSIEVQGIEFAQDDDGGVSFGDGLNDWTALDNEEIAALVEFLQEHLRGEGG